MSATIYTVITRPRIPESLARLGELANDLMYSWDRELRGLFRRLDDPLYEACGGNLRVFLQRVAQQHLDDAASDRSFIEAYARVLSSYDTYHSRGMPPALAEALDAEKDLIAYFCFEFGFHESVPLYSGGLGILAADHCKAASDLAAPFVAVGLLYRQGYFEQAIDGRGQQIARYQPSQFSALPIQPVRINGEDLHVQIPLLDGEVTLKVWEIKAGHVRLYLLDSDLPANPDAFRSITYQLYGGDTTTRICQEIALGIGGVRALKAIGLTPTVWHINEGHPALLILERALEMTAQGFSFEEALELNAANIVFTTHTPVPAGHDVFSEDLLWYHLGRYLTGRGIDRQRFMRLGQGDKAHGFNMTVLGLRGSRHHNGVSQVHGAEASRMERSLWPDIEPVENPIVSVTNGVHLQTFLALEWVHLFDVRFGDWRAHAADVEYWQRIDEISDHRFASLRQDLKSHMLNDVKRRITSQHRRNGVAEATIRRATQWLGTEDRDVLVLGFARRFATYKRATLIFKDRKRIARLMNDAARPVLMIIAGKAHPQDEPGQAMLREVYELSMEPDFLGRVILLENYDLAMARTLVAGVDVWLNTPEYPMEASGTSGMKAGMNGAVNLSILDGWWAEGYDGSNGFGIVPHTSDGQHHADEEAKDLLEVLEHRVIPTFFQRDHQRYSTAWIRMAKESMKTLIPRFNSVRMFLDYVNTMYVPAKHQHALLAANGGSEARALTAWKARIIDRWKGVSIRRHDGDAQRSTVEIEQGHQLTLEVEAKLNGLNADDVVVECVFSHADDVLDVAHGGPGTRDDHRHCYAFTAVQPTADDSMLFCLQVQPPHTGLQRYRIRMYPHHPRLTHPFEVGRMLWV